MLLNNLLYNPSLDKFNKLSYKAKIILLETSLELRESVKTECKNINKSVDLILNSPIAADEIISNV